jgi:hypothetical protein
MYWECPILFHSSASIVTRLLAGLRNHGSFPSGTRYFFSFFFSFPARPAVWSTMSRTRIGSWELFPHSSKVVKAWSWQLTYSHAKVKTGAALSFLNSIPALKTWRILVLEQSVLKTVLFVLNFICNVCVVNIHLIPLGCHLGVQAGTSSR